MQRFEQPAPSRLLRWRHCQASKAPACAVCLLLTTRVRSIGIGGRHDPLSLEGQQHTRDDSADRATAFACWVGGGPLSGNRRVLGLPYPAFAMVAAILVTDLAPEQ